MTELDEKSLIHMTKLTSFERDFYNEHPDKIIDLIAAYKHSDTKWKNIRAITILIAAKDGKVDIGGAQLIATELLDLPIEDIQEVEMSSKVSRIFTYTPPGKKPKHFWKVTTESGFFGDMNIHAAVQRWGRIGTTGRRKKNMFSSADLMQKTVESWVSKKISKGWEEKTEEAQEIIQKVGLVNTLRRARKTISPDLPDISPKVPLPRNWNRLRPLLEPAEAIIYETHNDSRTRHRRDHLSMKYTVLFDATTEVEHREVKEIAWKLLRTAQLRYLLSLQLYTPAKQEAGVCALEKLCKDVKECHPRHKRYIDTSLSSMRIKNLSIKKAEEQVSRFIDMVCEDIELAKGVGSGGTSLDRLSMIKNLTKKDDADLLEDYG